MKAIQADRIESLADYAEVEIPGPVPKSGQLRIRVAAVGVGYVDALVALGRYQVKPQVPHVPGGEIAGVVDGVGEGLEGWREGDRVVALAGRGFAELAIAPAAMTVRLPDTLSFERGAALPLNYLTALHGLADRGRLREGEQLLVFGAAGGVGMAAVQLGRDMGARVIAAASSEEKRAFALEHGAHAALDSEPAGWRDRLRAVLDGGALNVVFDPVCGPLFEPAFRSLGWGGRHLVVGFVGGPIPSLASNLTLMKGAALIGVDVRQFMLFEPALAQAHLGEVVSRAAAGRFAPPVGKTFPWEAYGEALTYALGGQGMGKTILRVAAIA